MTYLDERLYCQNRGHDKVYQITVVGRPTSGEPDRCQMICYYGRRTNSQLTRVDGDFSARENILEIARRMVRRKVSNGYVRCHLAQFPRTLPWGGEVGGGQATPPSAGLVAMAPQQIDDDLTVQPALGAHWAAAQAASAEYYLRVGPGGAMEWRPLAELRSTEPPAAPSPAPSPGPNLRQID